MVSLNSTSKSILQHMQSCRILTDAAVFFSLPLGEGGLRSKSDEGLRILLYILPDKKTLLF